MVQNSRRDALGRIGPALAQRFGHMHPRRRRALTLAWAIAFLLIASLVGTGLLVSSFDTSPPLRVRMDEAPTSTVASNVVQNHSPAVSESHTPTRTKTIARAQQPLNSLANSPELADLQLDLGSESQPLLSARANEFDVDAFVLSLPNADFAHGDFAPLTSPADVSSMLLSGAGNGRSHGAGAFGLAGSGGGGGTASGGGSAGGQQGASREALLAAQGSPTGGVPGAGGNAAGAGGASENTPHGPDGSGPPGLSGERGAAQGTSQTNLQQPNSLAVSSTTVVPVPEPGTLLLMGVGLCGLGFTPRRRRA